MIRNDWSVEEITKLYHQPVLDLVYQAASIHRQYHDPNEVQVCTLLSIKTGGCPEDCSYCSQSVRYQTGVQVHKLLPVAEVLEKAQNAKDSGSTRFCMGAAWREVRDNRDFDQVLEMVKGVNQIGLEVCCTLGMLTDAQARKLKDAGLYAYNHNLDTGEAYYDKVITTRTYQDRLDTIGRARKSGISVCSGGIIGLGETHQDRISMLHTLSNLEEHPESVPVNALVAIEGTPLEEQKRVSVWDMLRMIGTARITMPQSIVRLSAGRLEMTEEEQALCFLAGANSIFAGDKLLTTPNPETDQDKMLFQTLSLKPREAFKDKMSVNV